MKIQTKLISILFLIIIIMSVLTTLFVIHFSTNIVKKQIDNHLVITTQSKAHNIRTVIRNYKETTKILAAGIPFTNVVDTGKNYTSRMEQANIRINRTIASHPEICGIRILDKTGTVITSSHKDNEIDMSNSNMFLKGKEKSYISDIHISKMTEDTIVSVSTPISVNGKFAGVVVVDFDARKYVFRIMRNIIGLGKTGDIYIVNKTGCMITPSRFDEYAFLKEKVNTELVNTCLRLHVDSGTTELFSVKPMSYLDYRGYKVIGSYCHIPEVKWFLIAKIDENEVFQPIDNLLKLMMYVFFGYLLLSFIAVSIFSIFITKPIKELQRGTEEIIRGNLDIKVGTRSKDEIGELSRAFDKMTTNLKISQDTIVANRMNLEKTISERTVELNKKIMESEQMRISILNIAKDIESTNIDLKRVQEYSRNLIESSLDMIISVDERHKIVNFNLAAQKIFGYSEEEILGKHIKILYANPSEELEVHKKIVRKGRFSGEILNKHKNGEIFPSFISASVLRDEDGKFLGTMGVSRDITEQKRAEDTLQESEEKYRLLVENVNDGIVISQRDKFIFFNKQFSEMLGYTYDELFMKDYRDVYTGKSVEILMERKKLRDRGEYVPSRYETVFKKKNGTTIDVEANVTIIDYKGDKATFAIIRDITKHKRAEEEKKAMQAQLLQSQKLESIGTLASGVAHEINNPLMGMINYAELINSRIKDNSLKEFSASIIEEGDRVAKIVRNLLSFSRQDKERHSPANIKDIIDASLSLIVSVLHKDQITLVHDIPKDLPMIKCRSQQIEQVIINLLTNARDSLNERYPYYNEDKIVKISVKLFEKDGVDWIRTTIEDHGVGMQEDVIERIFDPFFTTKPRDIGTGLGLSVSYGLIKEHGGELSVESEPGKYSRFHIDLPVNNGWQVGNDD